MSINIRCPACRASLRLDDALAGRKVRCTSCREPIFVDEPDEDDEDDRRPRRQSFRKPAVDQPLIPTRRNRAEDDDEEDNSAQRMPVWKRELLGAVVYFVVIGGFIVLSVGAVTFFAFYLSPSPPPPPPFVQPAVLQNPADVQLAVDVGNLLNPDPAQRIAAAQRIRGINPNNPRREEVARLLATGLKDPDAAYAEAAAGALEAWATRGVSREVAEGLDSGSEKVRRSCYVALGRLQDPATFDAIARRLTAPDRAEAASLLRSFGPPAEAAVIPYVSNNDRAARLEACRVLGQIGSDNAISALETRESDPDRVVKSTASAAIRRIRGRKP